MKTLIVFLLLLAALFAAGCASIGSKEITDPAKTSQIQPGKTTKADVRAILGDPAKVSFTDNNEEIWEYEYQRGTLRPTSFIPVVGIFAGGHDLKRTTFTIRFDRSGVVKNVGGGQMTGGAGSVAD